MFLTGFLFGSLLVYIICLQEQLLPSYGNAGKSNISVWMCVEYGCTRTSGYRQAKQIKELSFMDGLTRNPTRFNIT